MPCSIKQCKYILVLLCEVTNFLVTYLLKILILQMFLLQLWIALLNISVSLFQYDQDQAPILLPAIWH